MTNPRIGDTVHYTDGGLHGTPATCRAAIVTSVYTGGDTVHLAYFGGIHGTNHTTHTHHDPHDGSIRVTTRPTPGTWHHIH